MPSYAITGASRGIGLEMVKQLAAKGNTVYALVRQTNEALTKMPGDVWVIPGIDVTKDDVGDILTAALEGKTIDFLVNNAGAYVGDTSDPPAMFASQKWDAITMDTMRQAFELNTLGVMKVSKAVLPMIPAPGGKIAIISTMLGSIEDNTSGGSYAYRTSKCAVNMVGKGMAMDLKEKGIAVGLIHPGMVASDFVDVSKMPESSQKNFRELEPSVRGCLEAFDAITLETTGAFVHANYGEGLKPCPW